MLHTISQTQDRQQNIKHSSLKKTTIFQVIQGTDFGFHNYNTLHPRYDTDRVKINP